MPNRLLTDNKSLIDIGTEYGVPYTTQGLECIPKLINAQSAVTLKAVREATLVFEGEIGGIDEFNDWSIEGLRAFRKKVMPIILGFTEALKRGEMPE